MVVCIGDFWEYFVVFWYIILIKYKIKVGFSPFPNIIHNFPLSDSIY